mgnify:CR=1 FL=1
MGLASVSFSTAIPSQGRFQDFRVIEGEWRRLRGVMPFSGFGVVSTLDRAIVWIGDTGEGNADGPSPRIAIWPGENSHLCDRSRKFESSLFLELSPGSVLEWLVDF